MKIVVDCDGDVVTFENGTMKGDKKFHERAKRNLVLRQKIRLLQPDGDLVEVGLNSPLEIMALLYSLAPGRSSLLEGPEECWNVFDPPEEEEREIEEDYLENL